MMKKSVLLAAVSCCLLATPAVAATFVTGHAANGAVCNSASSVGPFATGQVITYASGPCQGGYSVFLDTVARTITFTTARAPFADYHFSEFAVTGITETVITSLSALQIDPLFNTAVNPAPAPQLSFTGSSIRIAFGELSPSAPIFDFSTDGGKAVFAYNDVPGAVPEPSTWAMMLLGFGALSFAMRRRRKHTARVHFAA